MRKTAALIMAIGFMFIVSYTSVVNAVWVLDGVKIAPYVSALPYKPEIISDGSGGAIITWRDYRSGNYDIYAQRIDANGVIQWTADGEAICTTAGSQDYLQITSDGSGGAIITWWDYRSGNDDIYVQRINASGVTQWTTDGVAVCTDTFSQVSPQIVSDGSGGAIITWRDDRSGNDDIYARRIDANGAVQWTSDGVAVCSSPWNQYDPRITSDGFGGAIITWQEFRSSWEIFAQRIGASGAVQWTTDGVAVCSSPWNQYEPRITSDGSGGAVITWSDNRNGNDDIYAQQINASGAVQWTADGAAICIYAEDQDYPWITSDDLGGAIITWRDYRSGNYDIYAQRIDASGVVQWTTDGAAICTYDGNQDEIQITSDVFGGAIITWQDYRSGNYDIYAQQISASGVVQWTTDGEAVCTYEGGQFNPRITSDGSGGAIITWQDYRSGDSRIYAQKVTDIGLGPVCEVYPAIIDLPDFIQVGNTQDTTFTITNTGTGQLVGFINESCDHFNIISGVGSFLLNTGQSLIVTVRFEPSVTGIHQCTIDAGIYVCSDVTITGQAYSCPSDTVLYVDADATGLEGGSSWADALTELSDALTIEALCDNVREIWVAEGTYMPTGGTDRHATFQLRDSLAIYGGFAGTETMLSEREQAVDKTILSGDIGVVDDNSDNSYHVVTASGTNSTAILGGFTIINGRPDGGGEDNNGGGIYNSGGSPIVQNVWLYDHSGAMLGSGMYNTGADPVIRNAFFFDEIYNDNGSAPVITNSAILYKFTNDDSDPLVYNTILWKPEVGPVVTNTGTSSPSFRNSLIIGSGDSLNWDPGIGVDLGGNIDADPFFVDGAGGDLRLQTSSPAIDAGDNSAPNLPATDIAGNPRIVDGTVDMGAYEGGVTFVQVILATDPAGFDIMWDDVVHATPDTLTAEYTSMIEISVTGQWRGDSLYSFMSWSDGGDATHTVVVPDTNITFTAYFSLMLECAAIDSIVDVPADQGGWARIYFTRSIYDDPLETTYPIYRYDLHRRVDSPVLAARILTNGDLLMDDHQITLMDGSETFLRASPVEEGPRYVEYEGSYYVISTDALPATPPGIWEVAGTVSAQQQAHYIGLVPTLGDSASTIPWSVYYISAHSTTPAVFYDSPPDSGYSVDNIAPGVPLGLAVAYNTGSGNDLSWDPSPETDFQYYRIYRGDSESFTPGLGNLVAQTATPTWTDSEYDGWDVHYKVTALDHVGNESDAASAVSTTGDDTPHAPDAFALYQNVPNPFNPATTIRFDLPKASYVKLSIFNVKGELVSTIADRHMSEGRKEFIWTAVDNRGRSVSSGIYFYRLVAGDYVQTRKMVLLR